MKRQTSKAIIDTQVVPDQIVYPDTPNYYYNVLDVSSFMYCRFKHSKLPADQKNHIIGIENFLNQSNRKGHSAKKTLTNIRLPA